MPQDLQEKLVGVWRSNPTDTIGRRLVGDSTMRFFDDGRLTFVSHDQGTDSVSFLTYSVDGTWLFTDQPSTPKGERTLIELVTDRELVLVYDGIPVRYLRSVDQMMTSLVERQIGS